MRQHIVADKPLEKPFGSDSRAVGAQISRQIGCVRRMACTIDANADDDAEALARLDLTFD